MSETTLITDPFADAPPVAPAPTGLRESLLASVHKLAVLRQAVEERDQKLKAAIAGFRETIAGEFQRLEADKRACDLETDTVRTLALLIRDADGDKKPAPGVEVKDAPTYEITDEQAAFEWAKGSGIGYVPETYDAAAVIAVVKDSKGKASLSFVKKVDGFKTSIATNLGKALAEVTP